MEKRLRKLCNEHGLRTISVMLMTHVKVNPVCVYVHWDEGRCASGVGSTFNDAFSAALDDMSVRRVEQEAA